MKYELFQQVTLTHDLPAKNLRAGNIATIVDHHPVPDSEDGYTVEVFNALGETIAVVTVEESAIKSLAADEVFHVRSLTQEPG